MFPMAAQAGQRAETHFQTLSVGCHAPSTWSAMPGAADALSEDIAKTSDVTKATWASLYQSGDSPMTMRFVKTAVPLDHGYSTAHGTAITMALRPYMILAGRWQSPNSRLLQKPSTKRTRPR